MIIDIYILFFFIFMDYIVWCYEFRYLDELQKLQDRCPPYSSSDALKVFEKEIGRPFEEVFEYDAGGGSDFTPIAAASIGQVAGAGRFHYFLFFCCCFLFVFMI